DFAANIELAEAVPSLKHRAAPGKAMQKVATPGKTTCEEVTAVLGVPLSQSVKALAVMAEERMSMLLVRGDHQLHEVKASKLPGLTTFRFATDKEIEGTIGCRPGYIGPVG